MDKKERYLQWGYCEYKDTEIDMVKGDYVQVMNEQVNKIADLEAELLKFAHRISDQNEEILELKQQLAEKDELLRQKIGKMKSTDFIKMCIECGFMVQAKEIDNQTTITELNNILDTFAIFVNEEKESMVSPNENGNLSLLEYIEKRIDTLKGESKC